MHIGILQSEILVRASTSLKDKRRVVRSLKDRLHRHHQVSAAEVGALDEHRRAVIGVAAAAHSAERANQILDTVAQTIAATRDAELGGQSRSVLRADDLEPDERDAAGDPVFEDADRLAAELLRRAADTEERPA
jgi:hypothetical protein